MNIGFYVMGVMAFFYSAVFSSMAQSNISSAIKYLACLGFSITMFLLATR